MDNDKIYIFGHQKPDTDSITSAIALTYLKKQKGFNAVACRLGEINRETEFVLNYFNVEKPIYIEDVKLQIKDINYQKELMLNENVSVKKAYDYMVDNNITGVPLIDDNNKFTQLVTIKNITRDLIDGNFNKLNTSYNNILTTLDGEEVLKFDEEIVGNINIVSYGSTTFLENIKLSSDDIVILGDRLSIIENAILSKVKLIVLVGNVELKSELLEKARANLVNIIKTSHDTFYTSKLINLSNYIKFLVSSGRFHTFYENDYYDDFVEQSMKLKHNNYPIIASNNTCLGLLRFSAITTKNKKKVILVDHNESSQSVLGLDEAEILEIVDHHKIGNLSTNTPINFRNMTVGSTNTILYKMYEEEKVEIPREIAGLMISGILSDTLVLTSPTTTEADIDVVNKLAKIIGFDFREYALDMFKAGTSLDGKTVEEIINIDIKSFPVDDIKFTVSQVFTLNYEEILNKKDEYIKVIENMSNKNKDILVLVAITDIINNGSYILYNESASNLVKKAFKLDNIEQGIYLDGCVSRKKQLVPSIMEGLQQ